MADVSKIKLPSGTTYNIKDTVSGYTKNTGTITGIKTTAGAHTAIDVSSGAATFNVPTKTSHLTNDSGFINGNTGGIFYGTCSTSGDAIAKIVECSAFTSTDLIEGAIILVHFENTNNGAVTDLTMNVNNTGAKAIKYINNGTLINIPSAGHLKADTSYFFVYDGTHWVAMYNFNSTYTSMSSAEARAGTATSARSITAARLKEAILTHAPVTSINGETGDVTISVPQINYIIDAPDVDDLVGNVVQNDVAHNVATGGYALAEGDATTASGYASHAEGRKTNAEGRMSHAEGYNTTASGYYSHAEGSGTTASGYYSHAEGGGTSASAFYAHAEGSSTTASGNYSHAEGGGTSASALYAHAEGSGTTASGNYSHAEGRDTIASGNEAHAEGNGSNASGSYSHASGLNSIAQGYAQTVIGKNNIADVEGTGEIESGKYAFIIGNGRMSNSRSNALTVDWNGNVDIASGAKYKINGSNLSTSDLNNDSGFVTASGILDMFYPVGSYYETSDSTFDPNIAWGGTWSLEAAGLVHIGAGSGYTIGDTGGNKDAIIPYHNHSYTAPPSSTGSHTLTLDEIPSHSHSFTYAQYQRGAGTASASALEYSGSTKTTDSKGGGKGHSHTISGSSSNTGYAGTADNLTNANMQPYVVVNRWHRTA